MISEEIKQHLTPMCADYERVAGKPFDHFFCPLLLKDEPVELCMGHLIPESLRAIEDQLWCCWHSSPLFPGKLWRRPLP